MEILIFVCKIVETEISITSHGLVKKIEDVCNQNFKVSVNKIEGIFEQNRQCFFIKS